MLSEAGFQNFIVAPTRQAAAVMANVAAFTILCGAIYLLGCLLYIILLVAAIVSGGDLGGRLVPVILVVGAVLVPLVAACFSFFYAATILVPVTAFAEWLCRSCLRWPWWTQPFASLFLLAVYMLLLGLMAGWLAGSDPLSTGVNWMIFGTLALSIPLGLHWWVVQTGYAIGSIFYRLLTCPKRTGALGST